MEDGPICFPLSHCHFEEEKYEQHPNDKIGKALDLLSASASNVPMPGDLGRYTEIRSGTRNFRARTKLSIRNDEDDKLCFCIWEGPSEQRTTVTISTYPIASIQVNRVMPRLLIHIEGIGGKLREGLCACSFLTATTGETLISLIYRIPLDKDAWLICANRLRDFLLSDNIDEVTGVSILGRSRGVLEVVGEAHVNERLQLSDGRCLLYKQPEGAFSNPNSHVSRQALDWLCETVKDIRHCSGQDDLSLLELYCGNGNHTVALSPLLKKVVAVELSETLCIKARENLLLNGITNAEIVNVKSERFALDVLRGRKYGSTQFDFVLVDPPRCGLDPVTLKLVVGYKHIIYISCNPEALARDLSYIQSQRTYTIQRLCTMDQFAYTPHLEIGVYLSLQETPRETENT